MALLDFDVAVEGGEEMPKDEVMGDDDSRGAKLEVSRFFPSLA